MQSHSFRFAERGGIILFPWSTALLLALESSEVIGLRVAKLAGGGVGAQYEAHLAGSAPHPSPRRARAGRGDLLRAAGIAHAGIILTQINTMRSMLCTNAKNGLGGKADDISLRQGRSGGAAHHRH